MKGVLPALSYVSWTPWAYVRGTGFAKGKLLDECGRPSVRQCCLELENQGQFPPVSVGV